MGPSGFQVWIWPQVILLADAGERRGKEDRPETAFSTNKGLKLIPTRYHFLQKEATFFFQ